MIKVSTNFTLREFIDPDTHKQFGDCSLWFIDRKIINIAQFIRERFKKSVTINNWAWGGSYKLSGFRPPESRTGARLSQHRFGRGADIKILSMENNGADDMRKDIIDNFDIYKKLGLTTIEDAEYSSTWLHVDVRDTNSNELLIIKP